MAGPLTAYYNGEYLTKSEISIQLDDVGFVLGTTVSERLRTFAGAVFRLDDHLEGGQRGHQQGEGHATLPFRLT